MATLVARAPFMAKHSQTEGKGRLILRLNAIEIYKSCVIKCDDLNRMTNSSATSIRKKVAYPFFFFFLEINFNYFEFRSVLLKWSTIS